MKGEPKLYEDEQGTDSCLINPAINKTLFLGNSLLWGALSVLLALSKQPYNSSTLGRMEKCVSGVSIFSLSSVPWIL